MTKLYNNVLKNLTLIADSYGYYGISGWLLGIMPTSLRLLTVKQLALAEAKKENFNRAFTLAATLPSSWYRDRLVVDLKGIVNGIKS